MLEIQRLNSTEGERWRSIRLAALHDAPDAFGTTLAEANAFPPELWSRQVGEFPTFIAVLDGLDVGVVRASSDIEQPGAAFLLSMWVAPDARGKGVGDELIDAVASWAEADGFSRLVLDVADANGQGIDSGALDEVCGLFRVGHLRVVLCNDIPCHCEFGQKILTITVWEDDFLPPCHCAFG